MVVGGTSDSRGFQSRTIHTLSFLVIFHHLLSYVTVSNSIFDVRVICHISSPLVPVIGNTCGRYMWESRISKSYISHSFLLPTLSSYPPLRSDFNFCMPHLTSFRTYRTRKHSLIEVCFVRTQAAVRVRRLGPDAGFRSSSWISVWEAWDLSHSPKRNIGEAIGIPAGASAKCTDTGSDHKCISSARFRIINAECFFR